MSGERAPDRTLSDVVRTGAAQAAQRPTLPADDWFPHGTKTTSGKWCDSPSKPHFVADGASRALCDRRRSVHASTHVLYIHARNELCGTCLAILIRRAELDAKQGGAA